MATGSLPVSSYSAQLDQPVTIRLRHDSDLIAGLDDCHRQFGALYQRGWPLVWIAARARLDCDADADDVAQRVFPRLWNVERRGLGREFKDEFFRAAGRREALTFLRNRRSYCTFADRSASLLPTCEQAPDERAVGAELTCVMRGAIAELPPRCRAVMTMMVAQDLGPTEIARRMDMSLSAVEKQVTRGHRLLRHAVREWFD